MSAFEDDVEPLEEMHSRGGTPFSGAGRGKQGDKQSSSSILGKHVREASPEPDEELDTANGKHSMWLVKIPRFLLQGWTKVDEVDRRLGTVRVYE
jgi:transcription initiation factor TFIIF subunit beta